MIIIHTGVSDTAVSRKFYSRLGFSEVKSGKEIYFMDDQMIVWLNTERFARPGICLYGLKAKKLVSELKPEFQAQEFDRFFVISAPGGCAVYLMKEKYPDNLEDEFKKQNQRSALGNFAGLTLETAEMKRGQSLFETLGFKLTSGTSESPWFTMENESGFAVSAMAYGNCPHLFYRPSLSFFNAGNNLENIQNIRSAEVEIAEEISIFNKEGIVDNIILRDPAGLGFFVFND